MNNTMIKRRRTRRGLLPLAAGLALLALLPGAAFAHANVFLGVNVGGLFAPAYAPPPAVVYEQPAVVYAPPPRVYYAPGPVYYGPQPVYYRNGPRPYYQDRGRHGYRGHDGYRRYHHY